MNEFETAATHGGGSIEMTRVFHRLHPNDRVNERRRRVLDYVEQNPGCTSREVARFVLGGTGCTRTPARGRSYSDLTALVRMGCAHRQERRGEHFYFPGPAEDWRAPSSDRERKNS